MTMRTSILTTLCLLICVISHQMSHLSIVANESLAETTDRSFAATCNASPVVAYAADISLSLVANSPSRNSAPAFNAAQLSLTNAINGDSDPTALDQIFISTGSESGSILITFLGPKAKISGLGCQTLQNSSLLFRAKANDNSTKLKIAVQSPADSNTIWNNGRRIDNNTTGFTTHGSSGSIYGSPINDTTDAEGSTNGEIVFGTSTPSQGGYEIQTLLKVTNSVISNQSEELSLIFTPS